MLPYAIVGFFSILAAAVLLFPLRRQKRLCAGLAIGFVATSLALYSLFGSPAIVAALATYDATQEAAKEIIQTESEKLKTDDKNLESWIRLGQAFAELRQWKLAANAFKQAVLLSEGQPDLIMAYARTMIMDEEGKVSDHSKQSLKMILLQKPQHEEARYYMNVRLLQDGKTEEAMAAMKALYKSLPDDSPVKAMINEQIGRR